MSRPITSQKAFAYFGLAIGSLPPASLIVRLAAFETLAAMDLVILSLLAAASALTGVVGYALGRVVPKILESTSEYRLANRMALTSLIGFAWGALAGGIGGLLLFVFGAFVACLVGGAVGAVCVPTFVLLHNSVRAGNLIETKHFLPITFGITLTLCALVLGM
jgi:hypothetical protein